jgi:hypothetical protein
MTGRGDRFYLHGNVKGLCLRPYIGGDERAVVARPDFAQQLAAEGGVIPEGPKWTLACGDAVLGIGGFEPMAEGMYGAWAYLSDLSRREWLFGCWGAQAALDWLLDAERPVVVMVRAAHIHGADRVLEHIGFRRTARDVFSIRRSA